MMDEDLGFDDTVGRRELEVDHLLANTRMITKVAVSEVGLLSLYLCRRGSVVHTAPVIDLCRPLAIYSVLPYFSLL